MTTVTIQEPSDNHDGMAPFNVLGPLPTGMEALEASAGTGKTWTIAALVSRYVAEGVATLDQVLVVTFTRAATAELRDRIRSRLAEVAIHLTGQCTVLHRGDTVHRTGDPLLDLLAQGPLDEVVLRRDRVREALASFDAATITTIHGFCQRVLATVGHMGDVDGQGRLVENVDDLISAATNDLFVADVAEADDDQLADLPPASTLEQAVRLAIGHPRAPIHPAPDSDDGDSARSLAMARITTQARRRVEDRKRMLGILTFDDLLNRLADTLADPVSGPAVVEAMQRRFTIGLIDEFQDTDPVQWEILRAIFEDRVLVLIGDPKQAIYKFRGADIHAYLEARSLAQRSTLATNFRSDERLVRALGDLFDGTTFGDDRIRHLAVGAQHGDDRLVDPTGAPALEIRAHPAKIAAAAVRSVVAADLAAEITRLLASGATINGQPVRPGDCAVLVRTNALAELVSDALREARVPAVVNGVGSVLDQPAAEDWRVLLEAVERPASSPRVRALALTPILGWTPAEVAALEDDEAAATSLHDRVHRWARVADEHGFPAMVRTIQRETRLLARQLGQQGGERWLTDFEHLGELVGRAAATERLGPGALLAWLGDQGRRSDELPPDLLARRLESDALAVQIMTIHRSKGLQFPFVYVPYVMSGGQSESVPMRYRDPATGTSAIELGSLGAGAARNIANDDSAGEQLRLLYVALTRAEHRLITWWFPLHNNAEKHSPLSKVLFGTSDDPKNRVSHGKPALHPGTGGKAVKGLDAALIQFGDRAHWVPVPANPTPVDWLPETDEAPEPIARTFEGRIDHAWTRASYSRLVTPRTDRRLVQSTPDHTTTRDDEVDAHVNAAPTVDDPAVPHVPVPLGSQPAGAVFGTMVHAVIEHTDLAVADLHGAVREQVTAQILRSGATVPDPDGLAKGIEVALRTPLGPAFGEVTLAGTVRANRLDELDFELPLAQTDGFVTLSGIARLMQDHLGEDDPFHAYPPLLEDRMLARNVRGWLAGSIDLVLRRPGAGEGGADVFHVIDHKSNRLHAADAVGTTHDYTATAMAQAMAHAHYVLQALIYQTATHRFLRWRLPDYDPSINLGSVGYAFLRGLAGPDTPLVDGMRCGMLAWQPPTDLVVAMSDLLEQGGTR